MEASKLLSKQAPLIRLASLIIVGIFVFWIYVQIISGFFKQDEWLSFGYRFLAQEAGLTGLIKEAFAPSVGHYQPLNTLVLQTLFFLFGINYSYYAVVSIFFHMINVFLVYKLGKELLKSHWLALVAAVLFGITAASYQATSWVLADVGIHFSTIFTLLTLIFFFKFLKSKLIKHFWLSLVLLISSLFFKESTIGLFLVLPITFLLFAEGRLKSQKIYLLLVVAVGFLYFLFRVSMIFLPQSFEKDQLAVQSQSVLNLTYNIATFPFKGLAQTVIPSSLLVDFSYLASDLWPKSLSYEKNTRQYNLFVEGEVLEVVSLGVALLILFLTFVIWRQGKKKSRIILFAFLLVALNLPIFALAPERSGRISIIDSRNLYFVGSAAAILIVALINVWSAGNRTKAFIAVTPFLLFNSVLLNRELTQGVDQDQIRKSILSQIKNQHPSLPTRVLFYTESDKSYFGIHPSERTLPFQSGFGQTLLIWYYASENIPSDFLKDRFLWEITDQGYREFEGRGFGYFRDFELLAGAAKEYGISPFNPIAYRFESRLGILTDISVAVGGRLDGYFVPKKVIPKRSISVFASPNSSDSFLAVDGKRETFWSSKLPYSSPQFFELDLGYLREIAQVRIDSYNNVDQNEVGYAVLLSEDKKDWREVFFAERYPPKDNLVDLYFHPQLARYIRIEQKGYHIAAPWVIHELSVYESDQ